MPTPRLALAVVLLMVVSSAGVGATTATGDRQPLDAAAALQAVNETGPPPMGANISMFLQANAAQTEGTVDNGMWAASYARSTNASDRQRLVDGRVDSLNATLSELRAERAALRAALANGSIDRVTYQARLSTVVGRLAALGQGIDETSDRARAHGVNESRLETLRTQARNLSGGEVSRLARNLTGDRGPPWRGDAFGDGPPGRTGDGRPAEAGNRSNRSDGNGPPDDAGTGSEAGSGQPSDAGSGNQGAGDGGDQGNGQGQGAAGNDQGQGNDRGGNGNQGQGDGGGDRGQGQGGSADDETATPDEGS